ncbi:MAG TPA: bifunctional precorrin-2 dehydrogenase/sirohydrochlorin ferrochelatase, partial [Thermodesulfobacteriota bacterium]|nr:bifunctional precorrin-2 dehydrogenase/sirohydrochlorin ferrochelatase [Thermodesulfobacteriota bacterium]
MRYYPIFLDIKDKPCVVIGGGNVAERKVISLLDAGARVVVISPVLTPALKKLAREKTINYCPKSYEEGDLKGFFLAYSATDNSSVNRKVFNEAKREGILLNVVDVPKLCNFIVPSVVDRGDLLIAISTSGKSPAMAKKIRQRLEKEFGREYAIFLNIMGKVRAKLLTRSKESDTNKRMFEKLVNSPLLEWIKKGEKEKVDRFLKEALKETGRGKR